MTDSTRTEVAVRALTALGWRPPAPGTAVVNVGTVRTALRLLEMDGKQQHSPSYLLVLDDLRAALDRGEK